MSRAGRILFAGAYYHVYNRGVNRMPIVHDGRDHRTFMALLAETVKQYRLRLFCYCLMTNHFHLFLQTLDANLDSAMWSLSRQFSLFINGRHERVGPLFQSRYQARLVDKDTYATILIRYIHQNPLEANMIQALEDYSWSSYPCFIGKLPKWEWLDAEWPLRQFDEDPARALVAFKKFHAVSPSPEEHKLLSTWRGQVLGGKKFLLQAMNAKGTRSLFEPGTF